MKKIFVLLSMVLALFGFARPAVSHELEPEEAGHPLRVVAYILHPVGNFLYHGFAEPIHKSISDPRRAEAFGHREDPFQRMRTKPREHLLFPPPGEVSEPMTPEEAEAITSEEAQWEPTCPEPELPADMFAPSEEPMETLEPGDEPVETVAPSDEPVDEIMDILEPGSEPILEEQESEAND